MRNNKELYHYGMPRRSGRYKWGSGKNPFHHGQSVVSRIRSARADKKSNANRPLTKEEKHDVVYSGKAKTVLQNKDELSTKELNEALNRIQYEKKLREISREQRFRGLKKVEEITRTADNITKPVDNVMNVYNRVTRFEDTFGLRDKKRNG